MPTTSLGRLQKVALRDAWASEAGHFTPWLARPENLELLGGAIGIQLECEMTEKRVGPFRADILCKDIMTDQWVLIENQLEKTDHTHLGQLLTYATGLSAASIVWVAEHFTEEHRAVLDWLNEKTPAEINFFGLEVELWRIGNSAIAPKFNVVSKPNEWTRSVIKSRDHSEATQFCLDYWAGVLSAIQPSGILSAAAKPYGRQDTIFAVGWHTFLLKAYFSRPQKCGGVWLTCRGANGLQNFLKIQASKAQIEKSFNHKLDWQPVEDENRGSCFFSLNDLEVDNANDRPRQHQMFAETVIALFRALAPFVAPLDLTTSEAIEK